MSPSHRNACIHHRPYSLGHLTKRRLRATDCVAAPFGHEPTTVPNGLRLRHLIAHVRHVPHEVNIRRAQANRFDVGHHKVDGYRQGRVVSVDHHAYGITDQDHVDAWPFRSQDCSRIVISRQVGYGLLFGFFFSQRVNSHFRHGNLVRISLTRSEPSTRPGARE